MTFAAYLLGAYKKQNKTKTESVIESVWEMVHVIDSSGRFTEHISILKALTSPIVKKSVQLKQKFV